MSEFVHLFRDKISQIKDTKVRDFLVESLDLVPDFYLDAKVGSSSFVDYIHKTFEITNSLCDMLDSEDYTRDVLLTASLIQDVTRFEKSEDGTIYEDISHPLTVRTRLFSLQGIIGRDDFDALLRLVEASHGFKSLIPQVMPQVNDPIHVWLLPIASYLATQEGA